MTLTELNRRKNGGRQTKVKWSAIFLVAVLFALFLALAFCLHVILKDMKSDQHLEKLDRGDDNGNYIPGGGGPDLTRMMTRMEGSNTFLGLLQWITCIAAAVFFLVLFCLVLSKCAEIHEGPANDAEAAPGTVVQPTVEPMEMGELVLTNITVVTDDPEMKMLPLIAA